MKKLLFLLVCINITTSCKQNEFKVDLSGTKVDLNIKRLDADLYNLNMDSTVPAVDHLIEKYAGFLSLYSNRVIGIGDPNLPNYPERLKLFLTDYTIYRAFNNVMEEYPEIEFIREGLTKAFRYYKYYFPDKPIPQVYTIISGFNQSLVVDENSLAIALDKYLGRENEIYDRLMVNKYLRTNMHKGMIVSDCMKAWGLTEFPFSDSTDNLISNMLYNGKIHYFQRAMLPDGPDSIIMGFTPEQTAWCVAQEKQMWQYLVEMKLFFETDYIIINKFNQEAPFTKDFGKDSPGRAANWLGWQIVKSYMKKNPEVTLNELMKDNNYLRILQKAKYHP